MAKQTWMKWAVGLAGVTSFSAFVGVLNQEKGAVAQPVDSTEIPSIEKEQAVADDPIEEEWMNYEKKRLVDQAETGVTDYDDDDDHHHGHHDDDHDDDRSRQGSRFVSPNSQSEVTRTRAS